MHHIIRPRPAVDSELELVVRASERGEGWSAVNFGAEHAGDAGGQRGEKGEAGVLLDLLRGGQIGLPRAAQSVCHVRNGNGDDAVGGGDAAQSGAAAQRNTDDNFQMLEPM